MKNTIKNNALWLGALTLIFFVVGGALPTISNATTRYMTRFVDHKKPFITVWRVGMEGYGNESLTVTLPLVENYGYRIDIDWGDGSSSYDTNMLYYRSDIPKTSTHTYKKPGDYTVTISGLLEAWNFAKLQQWPDVYKFSGKLIEVKQLGKMGWRSLAGSFNNCNNLTKFTSGATDTSRLHSMESTFAKTPKLTHPDLSTMHTPDLEFVNMMFFASGVVKVDLSSFYANSCKECGLRGGQNIFDSAKNLKEVNVTGWRYFPHDSFRDPSANVFNGVSDSLRLVCSPGVTHFAGRPCAQN